MNTKPLEIPILMQRTEALGGRLASHHPMYPLVNKKAKNLRAGYNGEKSLGFTLSFLPEKPYRILRNLRIEDEQGSFQIDLLIISRPYLLIVEAKNISGTVIYDEFGNAIRISKDGGEESLGKHLEQINLQHQRLLKWLRKYGFPPVPIEKVIAHTNPSTIIKNPTNNKAVSDTVIHKEKLLTKMDEYNSTYKSASLTEAQMDEMSALLISQHEQKDEDVLELYNCMPGNVLRGVFCPECGALPMKWKSAKWNCPGCGAISKTAHLPALRDYSLIFGNTITNKQAREFLRIDDIHVARRMLLKEQFETTGKTCGRKYILRF